MTGGIPDEVVATTGGIVMVLTASQRWSPHALMTGQPAGQRQGPPTFDASVPHPSRMWNYWLGGKDHFAADREAADEAARAIRLMPSTAQATRRFGAETVRELAVSHGISQFLDIGTGLPVGEATHEVAQRALPSARVVYVDNDPIVASHARALLVRGGTGKTSYLQLDLRDTSAILAGAAKTLDWGRPALILLSAVVHFIPDADDPWAIVARLKAAMAPGSYLLVAHMASDIAPEAVASMAEGYNQRAAVPVTPRSREQVTGLFEGMSLVAPGVAPAGRWWEPSPGHSSPGHSDLPAYFGLGVKP